MKVLPSGEAIAREVVLVICASLVTAWLMSRVPALRDYLGDGKGPGGCSCR